MNIDELKKRAEAGDAKAQYILGCYYGYGVEQNFEEAVKWYRLAAEQGDIDAKEALRCIENDIAKKPKSDK